jgi:hypothetical protein
MRRTFPAIVCSGALAFGLAGCASNDTDNRADTRREPSTSAQVNTARTDVTIREDNTVPSDADVKRIRTVLAETVDAAMTKGGLDDVVERLAAGDRDRIGKYANNSYPDLDGRVAELQGAWRDRFRHDFKMKDDVAAFTDYRISGDQYHATAIIPAFGKMPAMPVRLVNEGKVANAWRIDIPDGVTGQQLKDRMLTQLTALGQQDQSMWPADMHEAYRVAAYRVFNALCGPETMPAKK